MLNAKFKTSLIHCTFKLRIIDWRKKEDKDKEEDIKAIGLEEEWSLHSNIKQHNLAYAATP